jgi:hypothetical protein
MNATSVSPARKILSDAGLVLGGLLVLAWAGCATEPASRVVSAPPPDAPPSAATQQTIIVPGNQTTTTTAAPAVTNAPATVIVQQTPPVARAESMPERPSEDYVWVAGYWRWENDQYVWVPGQWTIPPQVGATWIPPRWVREGSGYRFYDGYWAE